VRGHTQIAKILRKQATPAESKVWRWLRDRRYGGLKFRRQHPVGGFVLDFYCAELRLGIELDGRGHETSEARDRARSRVLESNGIHVVRMKNETVMRDPDTASEIIRWAIERAIARRG
jgi:very-short-patch-repair endonuclease